MVLFIFLLGSSACTAGTGYSATNDAFSPWDFNEGKGTASPVVCHEKTSPPAYLLKKSIQFFIDYISRVDGDRCPMYPTCSAYGLQATERHGFFLGVIMTADRLIHESDEMSAAPMIEIGNSVRYLDSVDNNDFWWYSKGRP